MTGARKAQILAIAVAAVLVVGWWVVTPRFLLKSFRIPTGSMVPTLPVGSYVFARPTKDVHPGDIAVCHFPSTPKVWNAYRIVAGGGDTVEIREKHLFVNGTEKNEPYAVHEDPVVYPNEPALPEPYRSRDWYGPHRVPADSWFLLGDNRDRSADSRYRGVVPREAVFGRVVCVVGPNGSFSRPR